MTYTPNTAPPQNLDELIRWLEVELRAISEAFQELIAVELRPIYAEPERPRIGMVIYADGVEWDPGSGEGLYVYKSGGWTFVA